MTRRIALPLPSDFSIEELAQGWSCHPDRIRTYIRDGWLSTVEVAGEVRIQAEEIERFEAERCGQDRPLDPRAKRSRDLLVAALARGGYGSDLSAPYALAAELGRDADLMGISLSQETIATILKEARQAFQDEGGGH